MSVWRLDAELRRPSLFRADVPSRTATPNPSSRPDRRHCAGHHRRVYLMALQGVSAIIAVCCCRLLCEAVAGEIKVLVERRLYPSAGRHTAARKGRETKRS
jgi:hypothetical protein